MKYKGIIFDLDGTLVDTLEDIANAANATLKKHQYPPHQLDSYRYFVGDGLQKLIERIIPAEDRSIKLISSMMESFKTFYQSSWHKKSQPYEGIVSMLEKLWKSGIKLNVLSNKPHSFTLLVVKKFFPPAYFSCVQGQAEDLPKKPAPDGAIKIAEQIQLSVDQIVFVGDTGIDIQTGKKANMKTIGVEWGFRNRSELIENGADLVVSNPQEIVCFIEENK